ncbi:MAG: type IV pilus biogenesis protein PilM [Acetobacter sp.]|jgi:hypothetical protein|nr:type IV pilus biogenesis protein PilM [Acetobacter sp.]MCI1485833.1 type IV pilus biogenesis protein PilM [Acetobacter sp.]MCI1529785.1 type IV pilus biogenesis protein PilM [Acetobacter sp.]MCI1587546.1 type IV pilus biogenesis protein PilM [Acetobacter sp.]MCI1601763.1 type IV pilus biogenesis protein PilM [Acetobacter sp.]
MAYVFLAMALVIMAASSMDALRVIQQQNLPSPLVSTAETAQAWLAYKAALLLYVENHPDNRSPVPLSTLMLGSNAALVAAAQNSITDTGQSISVISWMPMEAVDISRAIMLAKGDLSIGTAHSGHWFTPTAGDMGALPVAVPDGDVVSYISLSGTQYQ